MSPLARAYEHEAGMASRRARARTEMACELVARTDGPTDRQSERVLWHYSASRRGRSG